METLIFVAHHKNQFYGRVKPNGADRYGSSSSSRNFGDVNCRGFESGTGILPTPIKTVSATATKQSCSFISFPSSSSPKTPSPTFNCKSYSIDNTTAKSKATCKSNPIAINIKTHRNERSFADKMSNEFQSLSFSELWAGPAYSNSPPPSSLPIPKFSMRPKRTVSLDLPVTSDDSGIEIHHPIAKSAPPSPSREHVGCTRDVFLTADSATKTLRRILNLDSADE